MEVIGISFIYHGKDYTIYKTIDTNDLAYYHNEADAFEFEVREKFEGCEIVDVFSA